MKINLDEMTLKDKVVLKYLDRYLDKMSKHPNFNEDMTLKVYVNNKKDFTAFECKDYRIEFTNPAHKLIETIKSNTIMDFVTFKDFRLKVTSLLQASEA